MLVLPVLYFNEVLTGLIGLSTFGKGAEHWAFTWILTGVTHHQLLQGHRPWKDLTGKRHCKLFTVEDYESFSSVAQKCKTLNDFKFHTRENQRHVGLSGCVPVQEGYESNGGIHPLWFRFCWHYLNSHQVALLNTEKHSWGEIEFGQKIQSEKHAGSNRIKAALMISYYILILVIIMFLNNWLGKRQTASLASTRGARDSWEHVTCGSRKKSLQMKDLRSTSLLQIRGTQMK